MDFITSFAAAVLGHFVGDYLFQNQWMAIGKSQPGRLGHIACTVHVLLYTLAVALFTGWNPLFLLVVAVPHWVIDRWSLANYILRFKNGFWPKDTWQYHAVPLPTGQNKVSSSPMETKDLITIPLIQMVANNSMEIHDNVWRLAFAAPVYIFNDNTLHWVCLWFTCKYFFA